MSDELTERDVEAMAEALLLAMDGDFLPAAGMGVDNAGQDVPFDKARPKEVAWWAARTLAERIAQARREGAAEAWDEAVHAAAWTEADGGSDPLRHNPYRAALRDSP